MSAHPPRAGTLAPRERPLLDTDIDRVVVIERRAYAFPWSRGNFVDSLAAGYPAGVLDAGRGQLVGYFVAMAGAGELHLLNLTVCPEHHGKGHGSRLLDALEALALHRGLPLLWLEVRQSNHRARALYRRRGFAEVGLRHGYYPAHGGREDAVVMRLAIPPPTNQPLHAVD